ncbi:mechanosensitive ion channel family protein [Konateibacter massiliensis]|uniref:mechanosensitive ion channel family protein n=1 Tax=Konateibacter massiliensis TaxID=2002841 RepID=UPI000C14480D|nr:mechanosensitive ion channel domain-containing protein [Konateibacter massiliensis]
MLATAESSAVDTLNEIQDLSEQIAKEPNLIVDYFKGWIPGIINFGVTILISLIIYVVGKKIIQLLLKLVDRSLTKIGADEGVIKFINSLLRILLYIVLFLVIGQQFGLNSTSVVALLGSAGLAIGLALQGSLSNFAGGILILILKPFKIGDYIIEHGKGNEGTVTNIDIFYTKLLTGDNKVIAMPNGGLINNSITNVTYQEERRLDVTVGISYESDLRLAKQIVENILTGDAAYLSEKDHDVFVSELTDSAVIIGGRIWVKSEDHWSAKCRIIEQIKLNFDEKNIMIPYRHLDVTLKNENS